MVVGLLVAGIGLLLAGLLAIGYGIPINEFGLGNTLILAGTVAVCAGMILIGLWMVVRELKDIARRLGSDVDVDLDRIPASTVVVAPPRSPAPETADGAESAAPASAPSAAPWLEEAASRDRGRNDVPEAVDAAAAVKPRRNLLFSSSSRKERERAQARTEPSMPDPGPAPIIAPPVVEPAEAPPPASFEDAWPKSERAGKGEMPMPPLRRSGRAPSTFTESNGDAAEAERFPPAARNEAPPVTVLKSGVVDGMAYSLYSDGSIEAQMPEGMMRFASIDELRSHLDQRP
ncbi:MAG: hypothetical protein JWR80_9844 [Bradyrhizobium sp.]|nr:hypothetical protein [Bradyrhizobium sp.]